MLSKVLNSSFWSFHPSFILHRLTNKDRRNPPKIGTIITYKFQEYSDSGNPRFPSYVGVRIDMDSPKDAILPAKIKEAAT